jgi:hypothetical protein
MTRIHRILPLAFLATGLLAAPTFAQSPDAPAAPPKDGVLGGPAVPPDGGKGNDGFVGEGRGRRADGPAGGRAGLMPFAEVRALGAAVKTLTDLTPETKTAIETELKTFGDAAKKWEEANADKMKAMQAKMQEIRKASQESGSPPDPAKFEEIRKEREALMATAPQTKPVVDKVMGMLSPDQQKAVREKMRPAGRGPRGGAGGGEGSPESGGPDGPRPGRGGKGGKGGNPTGDKPMDEN